MNKKTSGKIIFLIIFGIFIFLLRLTGINEALYDDEVNFAYTLSNLNSYGFNPDYFNHPFFNWLYLPLIFLFGLRTWVFRSIPYIFGILNTVFVYFLAKRHFNSISKDTAFYATLIMLLGFYPTLSSLMLDIEGSLITFCVILLFFSYLEYEKAQNKKKKLFWQILSGIGLGIPIIKYNPGYLIFTIGIYSLVKNKFKIKETFRSLFPVYLTAFLIFCSSILLGILSSPQSWIDFIWVGTFGESKFSTPLYYLPITMLILWSTTLLFGFYILSFFEPRKEMLKNNIFLLILWITVPLLAYTIILPYGAQDRYFMNTIPAMALLGGFFISRAGLKRKHFFFGAYILTIFTFLLFFINSAPIKFLARFPSLYLKELKAFNLNFLFSYTSASGPTFGINFATLFWTFLISSTLLVIYLLNRRWPLAKYIFIIFLSVSLSFNIFLVSEYLFHQTGVDVSKVKSEMINYAKENSLPFPIYTNDAGIMWYFDNLYWKKRNSPQAGVLGLPDNELDSNPKFIAQSIKDRGGTIILLHWPPLHSQSPAKELVKPCTLLRQFYSKGIITGEIYACQKEDQFIPAQD